MVSKALVVGAYQRKLEELARQPDVELTAIVPPYWREGGNTTRLEAVHMRGYDLIVAPLALNGQFHLHFYPTLGRLLTDLRPDLLHMDEEPYNVATWHALRWSDKLGARSLFFTWQNLDRRYPWPFRGFELANYARAAHGLAGSQTAAEVLRKKGYRGPVTVIPQFGVDPAIFAPAERSRGETAANSACVTIGYAGRMVPEKGIDVLLRACAAGGLPEWRLLLRGEGPALASLEQLARELGISSRVQFLGKMPSTEMADFYRELDVFVLPSLTRGNWAEQFARVLIEAMACGVAILGSDSGEIPDVLGDGGLTFHEGNVVELNKLLVELAEDANQRSMIGARGRARVLTHFTQEHIAMATATVYRNVLGVAG